MKKTTLTIQIDVEYEGDKPSVLELAQISGATVKTLTDKIKEKGYKPNNLVLHDLAKKDSK